LRKNEESFATLFNEEKYEERRARGDVRFTYRAMQVSKESEKEMKKLILS
jgi:hypothetical protein